MATNFILDGRALYKKSCAQELLQCMDASEAKRILEDVHEVICGMHANGHQMAKQFMRSGYYWLTLKRDCINYARKCHKCQIYIDKIHVPLVPLHIMIAPWPFSTSGVDMIRLITPKASNGHCFILVAIKYFT